MANAENQINKVTNADEAVSELVGEQFIEWARQQVQQELKNSPGGLAVSTFTPKVEKLKKLFHQSILVSEALFGGKEGDPGFLGFVIANLSESNDPEAEAPLAILEKMDNDSSEQSSNRHLPAFMLDIGLTSEEVAHTKQKEPTRNYIAELSELLSSSQWQSALGGLVAYGWCRGFEEQTFTELRGRVSGKPTVTNSKLSLELELTHILDKVLFDREDKHLVWEGIQRCVDAYKEFLDTSSKYLN